jgi:glycosyltransferase involved in cell wall biosynthesis
MEQEFKRVSDLPLIAAALLRRGVPFVLDVVGDGAGAPALRAAIDRLGLQNRVRLRGWMDAGDIWPMLCDSDVLLLPSNREGMPIVMMEALAAGCAVVASRVSGVEDVALDERSAGSVFVHEIGAVEEAATLAASALALPCAERRHACRQLAEQMFSISACVDAYQRELAALDRSTASRLPSWSTSVLDGLLSLPLAMARATRRALRHSGDAS